MFKQSIAAVSSAFLFLTITNLSAQQDSGPVQRHIERLKKSVSESRAEAAKALEAYAGLKLSGCQTEGCELEQKSKEALLKYTTSIAALRKFLNSPEHFQTTMNPKDLAVLQSGIQSFIQGEQKRLLDTRDQARYSVLVNPHVRSDKTSALTNLVLSGDMTAVCDSIRCDLETLDSTFKKANKEIEDRWQSAEEQTLSELTQNFDHLEKDAQKFAQIYSLRAQELGMLELQLGHLRSEALKAKEAENKAIEALKITIESHPELKEKARVTQIRREQLKSFDEKWKADQINNRVATKMARGQEMTVARAEAASEVEKILQNMTTALETAVAEEDAKRREVFEAAKVESKEVQARVALEDEMARIQEALKSSELQAKQDREGWSLLNFLKGVMSRSGAQINSDAALESLVNASLAKQMASDTHAIAEKAKADLEVAKDAAVKKIMASYAVKISEKESAHRAKVAETFNKHRQIAQNSKKPIDAVAETKKETAKAEEKMKDEVKILTDERDSKIRKIEADHAAKVEKILGDVGPLTDLVKERAAAWESFKLNWQAQSRQAMSELKKKDQLKLLDQQSNELKALDAKSMSLTQLIFDLEKQKDDISKACASHATGSFLDQCLIEGQAGSHEEFNALLDHYLKALDPNTVEPVNFLEPATEGGK